MTRSFDESAGIQTRPIGKTIGFLDTTSPPLSGVTLAQVLPIVQDYDHRAELYEPDVGQNGLGVRETDFGPKAICYGRSRG